MEKLERFEIKKSDIQSPEELYELFDLIKQRNQTKEKQTQELAMLEKLLKRDEQLASLGVQSLNFPVLPEC